MMRLLVCGGRNYDGERFAFWLLDTLHRVQPIVCVIHGAAAGADTIAASWAKRRGIATQAFPANWHEHGRAAGPIRNATMLAIGKPDFVLAFPGGRGTHDMIQKASAAGVAVFEAPGAQSG